MFARKILHEIATIAALGTMGSTALADYDCFQEKIIPNTGTYFEQPCPDPGAQLVVMTLNNTGGTTWRLRVYNERESGTPAVWVTAFLFDRNGFEIPACHVHPSERLEAGQDTLGAPDCVLPSGQRPGTATIFGAEE